MDGVVAGAADHEGLAAHLGHLLRPRGLAWPGSPEAGELADLVDDHLGRVAAQLAPPGVEPVKQFLAGCGGPAGTRSMSTASFFCTRGIPPNLATRSGLPSRPILASKQVRGPCGVLIFALYLAAIFVTVDWYFAGRVGCPARSRVQRG